MITSRASILLGAAVGLAALAGQPTSGNAADLGSIKDGYAPPPPGRVWYLKGTIGMHNHEVGDLDYAPFHTNDFTIYHEDMKSAPFFGLGIGVEHSRWLRFDVTGEYRGKFLFLAQDSYPGGSGFTAGTNEYTADIESWLGLVNAYIDIGTWRGITPYVGGGIGIDSLSVQGLKDVNVPQNGVAYGADNTETNFAWALYAGMSFDVTPQFVVDLGYRYVDLGDAKSGTVTTYNGSSSGPGLEINDVTSHDLMLNVRWRLEHPATSFEAVK